MKKVSSILYLSGFADVVGGGQRSFLLLLKYLDRSRFRPVVLCPAPGEVSAAVSSLGMETRFLAEPRLKTWRFWPIFTYIAGLRREIRTSGASLVHCDTLNSAILAGIAAVFTGVPVVFHARVSDSGGKKDWLAWILCGRIICVSRYVSSRFPAGSRVRVIYNGVDTDEYSPALNGFAMRGLWGIPAGSPVLGYCGQLVAEKGLLILLEAFKQIRKAVPDARLVIVGRGDLEGKLREMAAEPELSGAVVFAGFMKNTSHAMAAFDALVLPSFWLEGLSRVLIEAMSCGKPVLATAVGGNLETVSDGETGFVFPAGDPAVLAKKALMLLKDRSLSQKMGEKARRRAVENFNCRRTSMEIHSLYEELC